jgi:hypothetical protein
VSGSYTDPPEQSSQTPAPRATPAPREWLVPPSVPAGTTIKLTAVIKAGGGGLSPEVFEALARAASEASTQSADFDEQGVEAGVGACPTRGGSCPHLTICGTRHGSCPELLSCDHFTALAAVKAEEP